MQTLTIGMCYHLHKSFIFLPCRPVYVYIDVQLCLNVVVYSEKAVDCRDVTKYEFTFHSVRTTNIFNRIEIQLMF